MVIFGHFELAIYLKNSHRNFFLFFFILIYANIYHKKKIRKKMGPDSEITYSEVWLFLPLFLTFLPFIIIILGSYESNVLYFMYTITHCSMGPFLCVYKQF